MVSVAYTRVDRGRERKIRVRIETKVKEKRIDFESNRKDLTLTLEMKGRGTYLVCAPLPPPVRATCLRRCSPDFTVQRSRRLAAPGCWRHMRGAREHGSVHGRLDGGTLTLW